MLIENKPELKDSFIGKVILLTGAGGGIGLEAAKAFAYLGAKIIIAEINNDKGILAEKIINELYNNQQAEFYQIDLAVEKQINDMTNYIIKKYGCPDVIFNNATITKMGAVDEVDITFWDKSYAVNLKARGDYQDLLSERMFFERLEKYWRHQLKLLQGYERNKNKLQENTQIIEGWIMDIEKILVL